MNALANWPPGAGRTCRTVKSVFAVSNQLAALATGFVAIAEKSHASPSPNLRRSIGLAKVQAQNKFIAANRLVRYIFGVGVVWHHEQDPSHACRAARTNPLTSLDRHSTHEQV